MSQCNDRRQMWAMFSGFCFSMAAVTMLVAAVLPTNAEGAKARFDKEKKALDEAYAGELRSISKTYIVTLNVARKEALEANNLDEAQRIAVEIKDIEESVKVVAMPEQTPLPTVAKLTAKDVAGKKFWYSFAPDKYLVSFESNGTIKSSSRLNDHQWKIDKDGQLLILQKAGPTVAIGDTPYRARNGIVLSGRYVIDNTAKIITLAEQK